MAPATKVFVSYSWEVEKETQIVDALVPLCPERGIELLYDRKVMKHGDSIRRFMNQLAGGEHIITIFSDAYFRSTWCMYELLTIWNRGDFAERTHAILVEGCPIWETDYRLMVDDFWKKRVQELDNKIRPYGPAELLKERELLELYRDISQKINALVNFAADRNITKLEDLKANHYTQLLDTIAPVYKGTPSSLPDSFELSEKDQQFLKHICDSLRRDLSQRTDLFEKFRKECSVPTTATEDEFVEYLVRECEQEDFDEVILHLQDAFTKCWSLVSAKEHLHLLHITKRLFSKLVLFNVRADWFNVCREQTGNGGCSIWSFPEMDSEQLSVAIARRGQFIPSFTRVSGRHRLDGDLSDVVDGIEHGMNKDNKALSSILRQLAARLAPHYDAKGKSEAEIVQYIKTRLDRYRRKSDIDERKHFFLMLPTRQHDSSILADPSVLDQVQEWLPELGWVRMQSGRSQPLFIIASHDYLAAFHDFFETIQAKEAELA